MRTLSPLLLIVGMLGCSVEKPPEEQESANSPTDATESVSPDQSGPVSKATTDRASGVALQPSEKDIASPSREVTGSAERTTASQAAAVAAIKKLGGRVTLDEKNLGKPVIGVNLSRQPVTDAGLEHLKRLTSLHTLNLFNTQVTDAGLSVTARPARDFVRAVIWEI